MEDRGEAVGDYKRYTTSDMIRSKHIFEEIQEKEGITLQGEHYSHLKQIQAHEQESSSKGSKALPKGRQTGSR